MKEYLIFLFGLVISQNNEINSLSEQLKPLKSYIGKTFKGEFSDLIVCYMPMSLIGWRISK